MGKCCKRLQNFCDSCNEYIVSGICKSDTCAFSLSWHFSFNLDALCFAEYNVDLYHVLYNYTLTFVNLGRCRQLQRPHPMYCVIGNELWMVLRTGFGVERTRGLVY